MVLTLRRVFAVSKYDVITFLLQNINPALGDGIDLIIFDDSVKQLLLFNHDGIRFTLIVLKCNYQVTTSDKTQ